jgi:mannitol/fructose-specific phosphotransferase system IIA component
MGEVCKEVIETGLYLVAMRTGVECGEVKMISVVIGGSVCGVCRAY